jgi:hypothetical protein
LFLGFERICETWSLLRSSNIAGCKSVVRSQHDLT